MTQGRQIVQYACAALDRAEIKKYVEFFYFDQCILD